MIAGGADPNVQTEDGIVAGDILTPLISKPIVRSFCADTVFGESGAVQQLIRSPFACIVEVP